MQTNSQPRRKAPRRPEVRSLKIQPKFRYHRHCDAKTSEIKLCGNWLEELGFEYGKRVLVTTMKGLLIINLQAE